MNRLLSVVRSMTDKSLELSRGVVTAPRYGESKRLVGVDQNIGGEMTGGIVTPPIRNAVARRFPSVFRGSPWRFVGVRVTSAQGHPRRGERRVGLDGGKLWWVVMEV